MTQEQKAQMYGQLLNEHTRNHNRINEIKGSSIDLSKEQIIQIRNLEEKQVDIMRRINLLMNS